jgi:hypothetical protein
MIDDIVTKYLTKNFSKIKFGGGVVGKCTYLGMGLLGLLITMICKLDNQWAICITGGIGAGIILYLVKTILLFAEQHKEIAILEGMELVAFKQVELGGKQIDIPKESPLTNRPSNLNKAIKNK